MKQPTPTPRQDVGTLDADIIDALTSVQAGEHAPSKLVDRVRRRVMVRIAQDATARHLTVQANDDGWHTFLPGIDRKVLHVSEGIMSYLLRLAPAATLPAHRHPVDEECVVLEGSLRIGNDLVLSKGGFHLGRQHVAHATITSDDGAVIYLRGAHPGAEMLI